MYLMLLPEKNCPVAEQIVRRAAEIGLALTYDRPTVGDGNCFYHSVVHQMQRPEISRTLQQDRIYDNHYLLRLATVQHLRQSLFDNVPEVIAFKQLYESVLCNDHNMTWEQFLTNQERNSVFVEDIFIMSCASLINTDIWVTSERCSQVDPYNVITPYWNIGRNCISANPIILGSYQNLHFQSLLPAQCVAVPIGSSSSASDMQDESDIDFQIVSNHSHHSVTTTSTIVIPDDVPAQQHSTVNDNNQNFHDYAQKPLNDGTQIFFNFHDYAKPVLKKYNPKPVSKGEQSKKFLQLEKLLEVQCILADVQYVKPPSNENTLETKARRNRLRRLLQLNNQIRKSRVHEVKNVSPNLIAQVCKEVKPTNIPKTEVEPTNIPKTFLELHENPNVGALLLKVQTTQNHPKPPKTI